MAFFYLELVLVCRELDGGEGRRTGRLGRRGWDEGGTVGLWLNGIEREREGRERGEESSVLAGERSGASSAVGERRARHRLL
jgi:hypothetical protein